MGVGFEQKSVCRAFEIGLPNDMRTPESFLAWRFVCRALRRRGGGSPCEEGT